MPRSQFSIFLFSILPNRFFNFVNSLLLFDISDSSDVLGPK